MNDYRTPGLPAPRELRALLAQVSTLGKLTLKRKWSDGTTHILLSPTALIGRLAVIVPPKGLNVVRHHGVLAARARLRPRVVPCPQPSQALLESSDTAHEHAEPDSPASHDRLILWGDLLHGVFHQDVEAYQNGGRFRLLARPVRSQGELCPGEANGNRIPNGTLEP